MIATQFTGKSFTWTSNSSDKNLIVVIVSSHRQSGSKVVRLWGCEAIGLQDCED